MSLSVFSVVVVILAHGDRRIEPHAKQRSGRQVHVLAFGGRDHATATNEYPGQRAFHAAQNSTDDGADACACADSVGLSADAFALESIDHGRANRISAVPDTERVELEGDARPALDAA